MPSLKGWTGGRQGSIALVACEINARARAPSCRDWNVFPSFPPYYSTNQNAVKHPDVWTNHHIICINKSISSLAVEQMSNVKWNDRSFSPWFFILLQIDKWIDDDDDDDGRQTPFYLMFDTCTHIWKQTKNSIVHYFHAFALFHFNWMIYSRHTSRFCFPKWENRFGQVCRVS
jgi:hypothetical protein